jgi:hypothetical protein
LGDIGILINDPAQTHCFAAEDTRPSEAREVSVPFVVNSKHFPPAFVKAKDMKPEEKQPYGTENAINQKNC